MLNLRNHVEKECSKARPILSFIFIFIFILTIQNMKNYICFSLIPTNQLQSNLIFKQFVFGLLVCIELMNWNCLYVINRSLCLRYSHAGQRNQSQFFSEMEPKDTRVAKRRFVQLRATYPTGQLLSKYSQLGSFSQLLTIFQYLYIIFTYTQATSSFVRRNLDVKIIPEINATQMLWVACKTFCTCCEPTIRWVSQCINIFPTWISFIIIIMHMIICMCLVRFFS